MLLKGLPVPDQILCIHLFFLLQLPLHTLNFFVLLFDQVVADLHFIFQFSDKNIKFLSFLNGLNHLLFVMSFHLFNCLLQVSDFMLRRLELVPEVLLFLFEGLDTVELLVFDLLLA